MPEFSFVLWLTANVDVPQLRGKESELERQREQLSVVNGDSVPDEAARTSRKSTDSESPCYDTETSSIVMQVVDAVVDVDDEKLEVAKLLRIQSLKLHGSATYHVTLMSSAKGTSSHFDDSLSLLRPHRRLKEESSSKRNHSLTRNPFSLSSSLVLSC